MRIDSSWAIALTLSQLDPLRGAYFQAVNLREALRAGESYRVARALSVEAAYSSVVGARSPETRAQLLQVARRLSEDTNDPYLRAMCDLQEAVIALMHEERWAKCYELSTRCERTLLENCRGIHFERNVAQHFSLNSLLLRGLLLELSMRVPQALDAALEHVP
jgi:hypothetical protein